MRPTPTSEFPPKEWDKVVADHALPNALFVAVNAGLALRMISARWWEGNLFREKSRG